MTTGGGGLSQREVSARRDLRPLRRRRQQEEHTDPAQSQEAGIETLAKPHTPATPHFPDDTWEGG